MVDYGKLKKYQDEIRRFDWLISADSLISTVLMIWFVNYTLSEENTMGGTG